jgi:hypothetical protein
VSNIQDTITRIVEANSWDQRIAQTRLIPMNHGTNEHPSIYAEIARLLYVPHLAPDFAYIHEDHFYGREYFEQVYADAYVRQRKDSLELWKTIYLRFWRIIREHC